MNKKTVRDGFEYYVEIEAEGGEEYEYQMLLVNQISSILPVNVMNGSEKRQLIYQASGYKSLENGFEKMLISADQILCIMEAVLDGADCVKKYLLSPNNLVLDPESIFMDYDYKKVGLVYVPGYERDMILQLRELMEYMVGKINHSEIKSVMLTWKLYVLLREEHVSLREIRKVLSGWKNQKDWEEKKTELAEAPQREELPISLPKEEKRKGKERKEEPSRKFSLKKWSSSKLLLLLCLVLFVLLGAAEAVFLFSIYAYGILEWKRNLLLLNTFLLFLVFGISVGLWKKDKVMSTLRKLREQSDWKRSC